MIQQIQWWDLLEGLSVQCTESRYQSTKRMFLNDNMLSFVILIVLMCGAKYSEKYCQGTKIVSAS